MNTRLANSIEPFLLEPIENESIASNDTVRLRDNSLDVTDDKRHEHEDYT